MKSLLDAGPSERGWHQFEQASRCLRLWAWNHKAKKPFIVTEPLVKGSLLHIGLAHYYQRKLEEQEGRDPDAFYAPEESVLVLSRQEARKSRDRNEASLWVSCVTPVLVALEKYQSHWARCSWKVVAVEQELRAHISRSQSLPSGSERFLFTQRADLIVQDPHGFYWIVDHKSCYRITSKTLRQHILSGQFLGYQMFGRKIYGRKFGGVVINRVKLSSPVDFERSVLEPAPVAASGFVGTLRQIEDRIQSHAHISDPMDFPPVLSDQVCYGIYGPCTYFELCRWGDEDAAET